MMQITVMVPGSSPMGVVSVTLIFTAPPQKLGGSVMTNTAGDPKVLVFPVAEALAALARR